MQVFYYELWTIIGNPHDEDSEGKIFLKTFYIAP